MQKKCWFYICIAQAVVIVSLVLWCTWSAITTPEVKTDDLKEFMSQYNDNADYYNDNPDYLAEAGYIPDGKTAKIVGSAILDKISAKKPLSSDLVFYDAENRLWGVERRYLPSHGVRVIIEQDTSKVVRVIKTK
jgi:hypothetical protein